MVSEPEEEESRRQQGEDAGEQEAFCEQQPHRNLQANGSSSTQVGENSQLRQTSRLHPAGGKGDHQPGSSLSPLPSCSLPFSLLPSLRSPSLAHLLLLRSTGAH
eukprot:768579-Hanusia_phi.AAC.2